MDIPTNSHKKADTEYPVHEIIKQRWSPRSFSEQEVRSETLKQLFDAARWAPSSFNEQPWRFIYARRQDPEGYGKLVQCMGEYNQKWASEAPVLILTVVKENFSKNNKPNRVAEYDVGAAMSYFTFEATRHNLYVHQMAGVKLDRARKIFDIPKGYKPWTMAAVGYKGDPDDIPEDFEDAEKKKRSRKEIDEIAFKGSWQKN
ncbi:MAG: nitroreductase family protein [Balneolaceae bacterium]|nr:nitroreductase family protein [Balneolaceae bacterium]